MSRTNLVEVRNIVKDFPGVRALDHVTLAIRPAEVLALVGENGAGKSTLVNILAGLYQPDRGTIAVRGREVSIRSPLHARDLGISVIFQEFSLAPDLSAVENIFLGKELVSNRGVLNSSKMHTEAREVLGRLGLDLDLSLPVRYLGTVEQQGVEIARALSTHAQLIIMDEPTSALHRNEVERLFSIIRSLKSSGISVVFISHKLEEVMDLSDRVAVLRDGRLVGVYPTAEMDTQRVFELMIGGTAQEHFVKQRHTLGEEVLRVQGLASLPRVKDVSFVLRQGEILGIAGLTGSGKTELVEAIFGARRLDRGRIWFKGKWLSPTSPKAAISAGLGLVPEDRKRKGLFLGLDVPKNITIANLDKVLRMGVISPTRETAEVGAMISGLGIKCSSSMQEVRYLSGGNQQKTVLAKWLFSECQLLLLDEPTRGIDVNAKREVYALMMSFLGKGGSIILTSSDLFELMALSDRVLVLADGRIVGEFEAGQIDERGIVQAMMGGEKLNDFRQASRC